MRTLLTIVTTPKLLLRVLVSVAVVAVYVLAIYIPGPALSEAGQACTQALGGVYGVLSVLGGGAISRLSPVSLGVAPLITAALIAMLAMRVVPAWKAKQGTPAGKRIVRNIAIVGGAVLVTGNALNIAAGAGSGTLIPGCPQPMIDPGTSAVVVTAATIVAGTVVLVLLAELSTRFGIGNGFTLLIAAGITVGVPGELSRLGQLQDQRYALAAAAVLLLLVVVMVWFSTRKVTLNVSVSGGSENVQAWSVPANPAGLMPLVMASVLMYLPSLTLSFVGTGSAAYEWVNTWFANGSSWLFVMCLMVLTVLFTFYQVIVSYDAANTARTFADVGAYVVGTHNEEDSRKAIDAFLLRVTAKAAAVLAVLSILPAVASALLGLNSALPLGGTSLLIVALALVSIIQHAGALARQQQGQMRDDDEKALSNPGLLS